MFLSLSYYQASILPAKFYSKAQAAKPNNLTMSNISIYKFKNGYAFMRAFQRSFKYNLWCDYPYEGDTFHVYKRNLKGFQKEEFKPAKNGLCCHF